MSEFRNIRRFETAPDAYVWFTQRQRQWVFSITHPILWRAYRAAAKVRCAALGHEWSPCWEEEKFNLNELGRMSTHCVFCGKVKS